jgi:hypothetical protein
VTGRLLRVATVRDEELVEGAVVPDPHSLVAELKRNPCGADIFSFPQKIDEPLPKYDFPFDWDNAAAAPTRTYLTWWDKLPQETRKNVRRASKKGTEVRVITFDDEAVRGIKSLYDETPVRQGARFPHFGKALEVIRRENGSYQDRCSYIGAYFQGKMIGFMRFVYVDDVAWIMQIVGSVSHTDKRPVNAMLAKAVEVCQARGTAYLIYSKFQFGNKRNSPLMEFKRRNGFEEKRFPRYFVPLTWKGHVAVTLKLHRGMLGLLPARVIYLLLGIRRAFLRWRSNTDARQSARASAGQEPC